MYPQCYICDLCSTFCPWISNHQTVFDHDDRQSRINDYVGIISPISFVFYVQWVGILIKTYLL